MALKPAKNGTYNVRNLKEAKEALQLTQAIKDEVEEIREANGIGLLEQDAAELKKAVTRWAIQSGTERIDFSEGFHATLVQQFYDAQFIATDDEMPDDLPPGRENVVPLKTIIEKKFKSKVGKPTSKAHKVWMQITKRVLDRALIDAAVAEGVFTVDEISPSFVEKQKAPYLRVFED